MDMFDKGNYIVNTGIIVLYCIVWRIFRVA